MGLIELIVRGTLFRRIKKYFNFTSLEIKDIHTSNILITLIFFFFLWSYTDLNIINGTLLFMYVFIISAVTLFLYISIPKIIGITRKCSVEYQSPVLVLLFFFVINFLSYGFFPIFSPGKLYVKSILRLKHGEVFHYETINDIFAILISAPIFLMIFSLILLSIYYILPLQYLSYFITLIAFFTMFSILPLPGALGIELFYVKKHFYIPMLFAVILFSFAIIFKFKYAFFIGIFGILLGVFFAKYNKTVQMMTTDK